MYLVFTFDKLHFFFEWWWTFNYLNISFATTGSKAQGCDHHSPPSFSILRKWKFKPHKIIKETKRGRVRGCVWLQVLFCKLFGRKGRWVSDLVSDFFGVFENRSLRNIYQPIQDSKSAECNTIPKLMKATTILT